MSSKKYEWLLKKLSKYDANAKDVFEWFDPDETNIESLANDTYSVFSSAESIVKDIVKRLRIMPLHEKDGYFNAEISEWYKEMMRYPTVYHYNEQLPNMDDVARQLYQYDDDQDYRRDTKRGFVAIITYWKLQQVKASEQKKNGNTSFKDYLICDNDKKGVIIERLKPLFSNAKGKGAATILIALHEMKLINLSVRGKQSIYNAVNDCFGLSLKNQSYQSYITTSGDSNLKWNKITTDEIDHIIEILAE